MNKQKLKLKEASYLSRDKELKKQTTDIAVIICKLEGLLSSGPKQSSRKGDTGRRNRRRGRS